MKTPRRSPRGGCAENCIDCGVPSCQGIVTRVDRQFYDLPKPAMVCPLCAARRHYHGCQIGERAFK